MRILLIHAAEFSYKAREPAVENYEKDIPLEGGFKNVLVVFTSVEKGDDKDPLLIDRAASEIINHFRNIKAESILIYPYAHLSSDLAPSDVAIQIIARLSEKLASEGVRVSRAPFGWYKEFNLKNLGHPLAELSRSIKPGERVRPQISKSYYIMDLDGNLYDPYEYEYKDPDLRALVEKEVFKKELEKVRPRAAEYMEKFGFEWEPYSDHGHMRYEPHAATILEAVSQYSWNVVKSLGIPVFRVKGTNMFDLNVRAVREHADLFGDRLYEVSMEGETPLVMRYAACHQQFAILKDWIISYKDLPLGMFEVADSYRFEQRGELILGFRLRRFYMPDLHVLTKDLEEAKKVTLIIRDKIFEEIRKLGRDYVAIINVSRRFLDQEREYIRELVRRDGRPALVVVVPDDIYYWVINIEYNIIDSSGKPREIATFQIDVGNARRFNIRYVDEEGRERYPIIIHTAIIGSVERYIYALFDSAALREKENKTPTLPFWVSPIQVRILPVSRGHINYALKVYEEISRRGFRVDIDDRDESLARKMRDAGLEWVYFTVIIGDREIQTETITVRERESGFQRSYKLEEFIELLEKLQGDYPRVDLGMPALISKRPSLPYLRAL
ncbi:MAG: threonine--tRNA ligase [Sulfolobales archaeon]